MIAFPTAFDGLAPFVGGLRALGNNTPIINSWGGDGNYWWPQNPQAQNYYYVTYGSLYGDDPKSAVNRLVKQVTALNKAQLPATGSFYPVLIWSTRSLSRLPGQTARRKALGSRTSSRSSRTSGYVGKITSSKGVHGVTGRVYRVMLVNNNKARFFRFWTTKKPANIG